MNRQVTLALLFISVTIVGILLWSDRRAGEEIPIAPRDLEDTSAPLASDDVTALALDEGDETQREELAPTSIPVVEPVLPGDVEEPVPKDDELAHVVGRLLTPNGEPAVGAVVKISGFEANAERVRKYGEPKDWKNITSTVGPDGRFDLAFDPPGAFQFFLNANCDGYGGLSWRWGSLPAAEVTDVGDQTFSVAATVVGRVVNANGEPTGIRWRVYADSLGGASGEGADSSRLSVFTDAQTGAFRLEGVVPGLVKLKAHANAANWISGPKVTIKAGEEQTADIVYSGPDLGSRITVTTFSRPFIVHNRLKEGGLTARDSSGRVFTGAKIGGSSQSYALNDLPAGEYTVEIKSDLHHPWSQSGVTPGSAVSAKLKGSASIQLAVTDALSGEAVEHYAMWIQFHKANFSPSIFDVHKMEEEVPPGGLFEGLIPEPCTVLVQAEGYALASVVLGSLLPGAPKSVAVSLSKGATVKGRVLSSKGAGVEGATVLLHPHFPSYDPSDIFSGPSGQGAKEAFRNALMEAASDETGAFQFEGIPEGKFDIQASKGQLHARTDGLSLKGEEQREVVLSLPAQGSIEGRLIGLRNAPPKKLLVIAYPTGLRPRATRGEKLATSSIAADGSFRIDGLVSGSHHVALYLAPQSLATGHSSATMTAPTFAALGEVEVTGHVSGTTFDATDVEPGSLSVTLKVNGALAPNASIRAQGTGTSSPASRSAGALTSNEGVALLSPIFPGQYKLVANSLGEPWRVPMPDVVVVAPGESTTLDLQFELAPGRMRILNAETRLPAAKERIILDGGVWLTTDADGWIEATLTVGPHQACSRRKRSGPQAEFIWDLTGPKHTDLSIDF